MLSNAPELKNRIYQECQKLVGEKLDEINRAFAESRKSLESESRSTAGDKHETGRAMIQLEQEKMGRQFQETQKLQQMLERVPFGKKYSQVQSGALVKTPDAVYFIATSLGSLKVDDFEVFILAPASPLAQAMLGKSAGEEFHFRNKTYKIVEVD